MSERPQAVLRLEPHQIPALRAAFDEAVRSMVGQLAQLRADAHVPAPWLGDPVSKDVLAAYHQRSLDGPDSTYGRMAAYRDELVDVVRQLREMEAEYRRTEGDNAALWGRTA